MKALLLVISFSSFACTLSQINRQKAVIDSALTKYRASKAFPLKSIRRMDFYGNTRFRLVYIDEKKRVKNANINYSFDQKCRVKFQKLRF